MTPTVDARAVERALESAGAPARVSAVASCASTNATLLAAAGDAPEVLVADHQTHGRGRRGRRWRAAPGTGLLMSVRRRSARELRELPGLSLAVGVAARRALASLGAAGVRLKWPNDLLAGDAKLGGILVETRLSGGRVSVVAGIGINWGAAPAGAALRRPATCLAQLLGLAPPREHGAAAIAREVLQALETFDAEGLAPFREEWEAAHAHAGRRLRVRTGDGRTLTGVAEGLGADGSLRLRTRGGVREILSGTVVPAPAR